MNLAMGRHGNQRLLLLHLSRLTATNRESRGCPSPMRMSRVYFNSKADAPNCWSVDEGTIQSEILVASVEFHHADLVSRLNFRADRADNVHEPKPWFEVTRTLSLLDNHALISG